MSWVKKRGQPTTPNVAPPVQMYNPNQHSSAENQWQQQHDNWYSQAQNYPPQPESNKPNYWQQPYPNQNVQPYQEPNPSYYQNNAAYQQPNYNQQYTNNPYGTQVEGDGWSSHWGWGDEDNSNNVAQPQNNITESFANDETWDWPVEDKNKTMDKAPVKNQHTLTGKRGKLETPQWSVESQLSQESSDDILPTSESDKSRMLSRSSTISHSPISGQDPPPHEVKEEQQVAHHFENKEIVTLPPPLPINSSDSNPYKRNTGLSHKAANKFRTTNQTPPQNNLLPPTPSTTTSFHGNVNLETLPDNSEQPDSIPILPQRKINSPTKQWVAENNEAPINDRNQYLETGQLSDIDFAQMPQSSDDLLPPPGLRRMVPVGQLEQDVASPPDDPANQQQGHFEPPEGLRRMIPGESSPPPQQQVSEPEFERRSATIGADTPPTIQTVNRSETIGADTSPDPIQLDNNATRSTRGKNRRDSIGDVVNSVRNLTVADDDEGARRESSDSDVRGKSPIRDRRYDDKESRHHRGRYSPDDYKKYESSRRSRYNKDRRYEVESDYYSDKERRHRDRDYDKKYASLKKEKDRRRRDDKYTGRDSRKNDYYHYEDYENESRSRASSRSDSMHESYRHDRRERRHRDKERHRRPRGVEPFNPYSQGFGYDMYNQYYQQYQYYENLRKTNPQAYAQLYRKYYQGAAGEVPTYGMEDRASVHSGRSSANDELAKDRYTRQSYYSQTSLPHLGGGYYRGSQAHSISGQYGLDDSSFTRTFDQTDASLNYEDSHLSTQQRLTPAKFATAHIKASIASGKLVKILPHYPMDGQSASVEFCNLESYLYNDEDYQELKRFPGPLIKGVTHKKTIIEYCENKIKNATFNMDVMGDVDSYILMWELLILLIRQNGMVVGTDIAELLLKNQAVAPPPRSSSVISNVGSSVGEGESNNQQQFEITNNNLKEEEVTNKFREYLLYGSGKEALEWAMKNGLWGHALFLASKLDKRTYANVMMRFANGLTMNDPLQTLYQLLSGRTPAAVTCVADEKWGDWRPHLAMILSNSTQRPELVCKAITIMGDTLMSRGCLYAAQFCYLMAEVGFGQYGNVSSKLVLLGSDHSRPLLQFATIEAIHMTEIYEYACSLNDDAFRLVNFQRYKYLLSTRLADVGLLERALSYLERIANFIVKNPTVIETELVNEVAILADRLKYYDPVGDGDDDLDNSRPDNSWLKDLIKIQNDLNAGLITSHEENPIVARNENQEVWQQQQFEQYQQQQQQQQQWTEQQSIQATSTEYQQQQSEQLAEGFSQQQQQSQLQYWGGLDQTNNAYHQEPVEPQANYYGSTMAQSEPIEVEKKPSEEIQRPQISLPNHQQDRKEPEESQLKPVGPKPPATGIQDQSGWFGGIFSKLTLRPKNQMKLPDDKNPSIVWDPEKKRWINTDEDSPEGSADFKPPPKMVSLQQNFMVSSPPPPEAEMNGNSIPPNATQPQNMFKLQRGRNLKKSYIDVFNPNGKKANGAPVVTAPPASMGGLSTQMNFFIPQPVNDPNAPTDFLTPAPPLQYDDNSQLQTQ